MMGGRGLCNGEKGLEQELKRKVDKEETTSPPNEKVEENSSDIDEIPKDGFDKEMMGLTGGFPGGEKGLIKFIQDNPPRSRNSSDDPFIMKESNQSLLEESKTS
ncbi:hypothetical protein L195_g003419 [Trifolium pratense]|uniref:Uncharacterized protein n=1 Tax=Trifolium pratense TaxID=57577 RepID=A0A2K3NV82_TRIPR|nr:hypothetical protein L195_g003419 [Trifolium pratense]